MIILPGSDWDLNGCIASAGYIWCDILGKCVREWINVCEYPDNCLVWNDGCNNCSLIHGKLTMCSEMYCFKNSNPLCIEE